MVYLVWTCAGVHMGVYLTLWPELSAVNRQSGAIQSAALFSVACLVTTFL